MAAFPIKELNTISSPCTLVQERSATEATLAGFGPQPASTIKVNVRNQDVPRSRADGFDYDPVSKAIVFYGANFRPAIGDQVYISYRVWAGSTN